MNENMTDKFINSLISLKNTELTDEVITNVKKSLLDYLGVTLAGAKIIQKKNNKLIRNINSIGNFRPIGLKIGTDVLTGALINGLSSHVIELDDGIRYGVLHPGVSVFSALIPLVMTKDYNVEDFVSAVVIGYEASIRLAFSMQPTHYKCGYHPSSTCGTVGTTAAIAALRNYNFEKFKSAVSAAMIVAGGSLKVIEDSSEIKPYNIGNAAMTAIVSANIAEAGFISPIDALSGDAGFFSIMCDEYNQEILFNPSKWDYAINKTYFKIYAACRHCHPSIEAMLAIRKQIQDINLINSIEIQTYKGVIGKHDFKDIYGVSSAKMSIPFCACVALLYGKYSLDAFDEKYIYDDMIKKLMSNTSVIANEEISKLVPNIRAAVVKVKLKNGEIISKRIDYPKGEPENPLSKKELETKFKQLALFAGKTNTEAQKIIDCVWNLEHRFKELFTLI